MTDPTDPPIAMAGARLSASLTEEGDPMEGASFSSCLDGFRDVQSY
jgi:hypothetical protein